MNYERGYCNQNLFLMSTVPGILPPDKVHQSEYLIHVAIKIGWGRRVRKNWGAFQTMEIV